MENAPVSLPKDETFGVEPRFIEQYGSPIEAIKAALVRIHSSGNIERFEREILKADQMDCPVIHRFAPGIYIREITLPAGAIATGAYHKKPVLNVMLTGRVTVPTDGGGTTEMVAPLVFVGVIGKKVGFIHEDTIWQNVFATTETDVEKIEEEFIDKGEAWREDHARRQPTERDLEARADYPKMLAEYGFTHEQARAETETTADMIPFPFGGYKAMVSGSLIEGRGLFATAPIEPGEVIAPARINGCRTPAGRYTNHSGTPNAEFIELPNGDLNLVAIKKLGGMVGGRLVDEITIDYRKALEIRERLCQQLFVHQ